MNRKIRHKEDLHRCGEIVTYSEQEAELLGLTSDIDFQEAISLDDALDAHTIDKNDFEQIQKLELKG
jgi:hypothetical protein